MRDILQDVFGNQPLDPMEAARRAVRPQLRRRFYKAVDVTEGDQGYALTLDGRPVKTPARRALATPVRDIGASPITPKALAEQIPLHQLFPQP